MERRYCDPRQLAVRAAGRPGTERKDPGRSRFGAGTRRARATVNLEVVWMRAIGGMLFIAWMGSAQVGYPAGSPENAPLVTGILLECDARAAGEFSIRAADNRVLRYQFDHKTYVEREERLIEPARLVAGEKVEVL